jgi:predicted AlkP superfamily pyrophosphatase or phosphodiesterase
VYLFNTCMKKIFNFLICFLYSITLLAQKQDQPIVKYVVLISIDGLRPDFYMDPSWPTPNLQYLKNRGAYAQGVRGIFPTVTYPSHTTIITGAYPANMACMIMKYFLLIQVIPAFGIDKPNTLKCPHFGML